MPITFVFSCFALFGLLLLIPAVPISVALLLTKKKRAALVVLCIPIGMIVMSILLTLLVFAGAELHSRIMSARPAHLFRVTFGFQPPPDTCVLEAYHQSIMDYGMTVLKFRTTQEVIDRITSRNFTRGDKEAFLRSYGSNEHNLAEGVRSWFLPAAEADQFYMAKPFDKSFASNEAVLSYNEKTQVACFHWVGVD
jgi:ABC-type transport system involved in cytochrome c biogenesis permease subunit